MASRLEGGRRLRAILKELPEHARAEVAQALDQGIRMVQAKAVSLAPARTGRLRRGLASPEALGKSENGLTAEFGLLTKQLQDDLYYASFVEYGTKGYEPGDRRRTSGRTSKRIKRRIPARPAKPYMRPAIDLTRPAIRALVAAAVKRAIARRGNG